MLTIIQAAAVDVARTPSTGENRVNRKADRDSEKSDIFASLVSEPAGEDNPHDKSDEIADSQLPESDVDANETKLRGTQETEADDLKDAASMPGAAEEKALANASPRANEFSVDGNAQHPETVQNPRGQSEAEDSGDGRAPNFQRADVGRGAENALNIPSQNSDFGRGRSSFAPGTVVRNANADPSEKLSVLADGAVTRPSHENAMKGLIASDRMGVAVQKETAGMSDSKPVAFLPAENPGQQNSVTKMIGENTQAVSKMALGEKLDALPKSGILGNPTQGQPALVPPHQQIVPPHQAHAPTPRFEALRQRESGHPVADSDLVREMKVPEAVRTPTVTEPSVLPISANGIAVTSQMESAKSDSDVLRFGLTSTTESIVQSTTTDVSHRPTTSQQNDIARSIARQLAEVGQRMPDRPVEVALNPEELGRVKMSISAHDAGITMTLLAERTETLDLMRRHIDQLAQEFHALGFGDVRFSFSQNKESGEGNVGQEKASSSASADDFASDVPVQLSINPNAGLDLRL